MRKLNQKICSSIMRKMHVADNFSSDEGEIIRYMLVTQLSEIEKIILLFLLFIIMGQLNNFLWVCFATLLTHPFTGGLHRETFWGCFFQSFIFFAGVITFGELVPLTIQAVPFVFIFSIIIYSLYVPTTSEKRGKYGEASRRRIRRIAFAGLVIVSIMSLLIRQYRPFFLWVLILEDLEILLLNIHKKEEQK